VAFGRRQVLCPVEIDCNELLDSMHKLLRRTMREDIEIKTDFAPDIPSAFADPAQLESAVLNIALNAQDAMPAGGRLTISTANASLDDHYTRLHPEVLPGEYVLVSITDDGEGMPKEVIERVFEPFFTTKLCTGHPGQKRPIARRRGRSYQALSEGRSRVPVARGRQRI